MPERGGIELDHKNIFQIIKDGETLGHASRMISGSLTAVENIAYCKRE